MDYFNDLNPYLVRQDPAPAETPDTTPTPAPAPTPNPRNTYYTFSNSSTSYWSSICWKYFTDQRWEIRYLLLYVYRQQWMAGQNL